MYFLFLVPIVCYLAWAVYTLVTTKHKFRASEVLCMLILWIAAVTFAFAIFMLERGNRYP